jgi:hypothetical protein
MKTNLNRRVVSLEERAGISDSWHVIFLNEGETQQEAKQRYCHERGFGYEQLKTVVYLDHKDAATL